MDPNGDRRSTRRDRDSRLRDEVRSRLWRSTAMGGDADLPIRGDGRVGGRLAMYDHVAVY